MKRVLIISDSHDNNYNVQKAIEKAKALGGFDLFVHLGDVGNSFRAIENAAGVTCYMVRGNCDYSPELRDFCAIDICGHKVFMTHGHRYNVNMGLDVLRYAALEKECDIALFGHIHRPVLEEGDVTIVNPGSISLPRQEDHKKTFVIAVFSDDGKVEFNFYNI